MLKAGFIVSRYSASTFYHRERNLKTMVHGDDFVTSGKRDDVKWLKRVLEKRFEVSTTIIGTREDEIREARILNRVIRVSESGWFYEADQRHAELIVKALNLEGAKGVATPGEDEKPWKEDEDADALKGKDASSYRAITARANYLALDRPDLQFAVKEACRGMANPTRGDLRKLRRIGRYLISHSRSVSNFVFQGRCEELSGYSDSDWAGCRRTAKSTSGGAIMMGRHCLKTWAATQKNSTLSSGEAELVAAVKMSCEVIGMLQLAEGWGITISGSVYVDSTAALGAVARKGNGKMRHIKVGMLWVQEKSEDGTLKYRKVPGTENPGDLMTKNVPKKTAEVLMDIIGQEIVEGRASASLKINP